MAKPKAANKFLQTRTGLGLTALLALALSYAAVSRAIDTGSLLEYALGFLLAGFAIQRLIRMF